MRIPILYQDDDIIAVNKPAGIPTHAPAPGDPYPGDALRIVQAQTGLSYLGMHQRLDAETSGVLLFAARPQANPRLAAAFETGQVHKTYLALVHGRPSRPEGVITAPIVRERGERYRIAAPGDRRGQPARTRYRLLATVPDADLSLLEVIPETGRSHQIRLHLEHIGLPVVGDRLYGPADRPAPRLCLHAHSLTLPHPGTGRPVTITAPVPAPLDRPQSAAAALALAASSAPIREAAATPEALDAVRMLLELAVRRRAPLAADPETTIYRLVNGPGDGLPGLTVDRYGDALVVSIYEGDEAPLPPRPVPDALLEALAGATGAMSIYVKFRPRQASRIPEASLPSLAPPAPLLGPDLGEFAAWEEGLAYLVRPGEGLSTGLFPDMREGRARVRAWAAGRRVLNCFAYTCGFGVAATAGGAARVLNLDLSRSALAWGQANYHANGLEPDPRDFVYGDVFDWLGRLARRGERFDLVILDPPGFSKAGTRRFSAAHDYGQLAARAAPVVEADGLLLACCNVAEHPWRRFRDQVLAGVAEAGRTGEVVGVYHEPAVDFPVAPGREPYLKMLAVRLR